VPPWTFVETYPSRRAGIAGFFTPNRLWGRLSQKGKRPRHRTASPTC